MARWNVRVKRSDNANVPSCLVLTHRRVVATGIQRPGWRTSSATRTSPLGIGPATRPRNNGRAAVVMRERRARRAPGRRPPRHAAPPGCAHRAGPRRGRGGRVRGYLAGARQLPRSLRLRTESAPRTSDGRLFARSWLSADASADSADLRFAAGSEVWRADGDRSDVARAAADRQRVVDRRDAEIDSRPTGCGSRQRGHAPLELALGARDVGTRSRPGAPRPSPGGIAQRAVRAGGVAQRGDDPGRRRLLRRQRRQLLGGGPVRAPQGPRGALLADRALRASQRLALAHPHGVERLDHPGRPHPVRGVGGRLQRLRARDGDLVQPVEAPRRRLRLAAARAAHEREHAAGGRDRVDVEHGLAGAHAAVGARLRARRRGRARAAAGRRRRRAPARSGRAPGRRRARARRRRSWRARNTASRPARPRARGRSAGCAPRPSPARPSAAPGPQRVPSGPTGPRRGRRRSARPGTNRPGRRRAPRRGRRPPSAGSAARGRACGGGSSGGVERLADVRPAPRLAAARAGPSGRPVARPWPRAARWSGPGSSARTRAAPPGATSRGAPSAGAAPAAPRPSRAKAPRSSPAASSPAPSPATCGPPQSAGSAALSGRITAAAENAATNTAAASAASTPAIGRSPTDISSPGHGG